jgi:hypothetical protein
MGVVTVVLFQLGVLPISSTHNPHVGDRMGACLIRSKNRSYDC